MDGSENVKPECQSGGRNRDVRISSQAAITTTPCLRFEYRSLLENRLWVLKVIWVTGVKVIRVTGVMCIYL